MKIIGNTIQLKSFPENWEKEKSGLKNNTVREIPKHEFEMFMDFTFMFAMGEVLKVELIQTTEPHKFERQITDITKFKDNIYIISFR